MEKFELTLDEDNSIIIPEPVLKELKMKKGDTFVLSVEKDEIKLEKKKKLSQDDYDALISMAAEYAKETGLDTLDCYSIVEEYINSL